MVITPVADTAYWKRPVTGSIALMSVSASSSSIPKSVAAAYTAKKVIGIELPYEFCPYLVLIDAQQQAGFGCFGALFSSHDSF